MVKAMLNTEGSVGSRSLAVPMRAAVFRSLFSTSSFRRAGEEGGAIIILWRAGPVGVLLRSVPPVLLLLPHVMILVACLPEEYLVDGLRTQ